MCGIAGLISKNSLTKNEKNDFIRAAKLMEHRGPDYFGVEAYDRLLLCHLRLSIIDLDPRSNQPFHSQSGRYAAVYNGEIYNFEKLKYQFGIQAKTSSDTEIMLESFERAGLDAITQWNGIFACTIFDKEEQVLYLIRDRFGVKPLYIYEDGTNLAFASEAKVILNWLDGFELNTVGLSQYMWYGNTTGSETMIKGLRKLEPGHILRIDLKTGQSEDKAYWSVNDIAEIQIDANEAVEHIRGLLGSAVRHQLIADVPLGILLSGGVDSSGLVAFAADESSLPLSTYSIEYDYNLGGESELEKARKVAAKYSTQHHEMKVGTDDVKAIFSNLVFQFDEPFADPASIPLYQLARACALEKKVLLQGDGADEIFGGYRRYNIYSSFSFWKAASALYPLIPRARWKERMHRMHHILAQKEEYMRKALMLTQDVPYKNPLQIFTQEWQHRILREDAFRDYKRVQELVSHRDRVQQLLYTDMQIILPNTYFEKVDKATMFATIESRVPYLDNDLTQFVLSLPASLKIQGREKKYLLKKALEGKVPNEILYGPKRGFDVPFKQWLRGDLNNFAKEAFAEMPSFLVDNKRLLEVLELHTAGKGDYGTLLWKSLVLAHWLELYKSKIRFT